ncbi:toll/interleukin-1 receptor domain-containing protein [Evansella sp. AB-rgal1]|uniref:toll/interleukin-1 receptor domain-containing protein n=1 Tax=Evansella sp. AB-rgal1 TaxID=3242696 RepID=UPI00359D52A6
MGYDIFLSHRGPDKDFVKQLAAFLEPEIKCWYAPRNILESDNYSSEVLSGIEGSNVFLVYLTKEFETDPDNFVTNEVFHARKSKKRIIPILKGRTSYPRVLEMHLNATQWFHFDDYETEEEALQQLRSIVQLLLNDKDNSMDADTFLRHTNKRVLHKPNGFLQVGEKALDKYKHVFTPSQDVKEISPADRVLLMYGENQVGKTTHAVNLFLKQDKSTIFEGLSLEAFQSLLNEPLHENAGYIVEISSSELKKVLTENVSEILKERLGKASASLVICTDAPVTYLNCMEIDLPSNKGDFILNHVNWNLREQGMHAVSSEFMKNMETEVNVDEMEDIETLTAIIKLIISHLKEQQSFDEMVESIRFLKTNKAQLPFDLQHSNIDDLLYNLALSFHHGKRYATIVDTYQQLVDEYNNHFPTQQISFHMRSLTKLKTDFHLKVVKEESGNHLGLYHDDHIYYKHDFIAENIWPMVWLEYPYLQEYLSSFLIKQITNKSAYSIRNVEEVILSLIDAHFEIGIDKLIYPMAKSVHFAENQMAKQILVSLYEQTKYQIKIHRLLKNWIYTRNNKLERTALLTLQSNISIENFKDTLEWLLDLFRNHPTQTLYITFSYLSKYIYLNEEFEKLYYRTLAHQLKVWEDNEVYAEYVRLIGKLFTNHATMFYRSKSPFVEKFLAHILIELANREDASYAGRLLGRYYDEISEDQEKREKYKGLLRNLRDKLEKSEFENLVNMMKKGA